MRNVFFKYRNVEIPFVQLCTVIWSSHYRICVEGIRIWWLMHVLRMSIAIPMF